jgi:hypothetical protein
LTVHKGCRKVTGMIGKAWKFLAAGLFAAGLSGISVVAIPAFSQGASPMPTFTLADIESVTRTVEGVEAARDAGYTVYLICLASGEQRSVRVSNGPLTREMFESAFRAAGYVGDIVALTEMAVEDPR